MKGITRVMPIIMGTTLCLLLPTALAKEEKILRYPPECEPIGYQFKHFNLLLKPTAKFHPQTAYFIHNISNQSVNLFQARTGDEPYIIHANNTIRPNNWSVLAQDEKKTEYICTTGGKDITDHRVIDCSKALDVCEFPRTKFGGNHRGNYWVVENAGTWKSAMLSARYHGILLVDPKKRD